MYSYRVLASKSNYHLKVPEKKLDLVAGYHGLIFIDEHRHFVHRITVHPDGIPASFPIQDVSLALDYEYTRIGDADFLLPLEFELRSREGSTAGEERRGLRQLSQVHGRLEHHLRPKRKEVAG